MEIHPKTKVREEKSDLKKQERIGVVMHEINKPHALYDNIWTPNSARAGPCATFAVASPSCTASGSTNSIAMNVGDVMQLTTAVKVLDELCKCTHSNDAQLIFLRNRSVSLLAVWTRALDQQTSLCGSATVGSDGSATVGSGIAKAYACCDDQATAASPVGATRCEASHHDQEDVDRGVSDAALDVTKPKEGSGCVRPSGP